MALVLTTATNPGAAAWTPATALPGSVKFNGLAYSSSPIPGSDTTLQPFDSSLTLPANTLAPNDYIQINFTIFLSTGVAPPPFDTYQFGLRIAGLSVITPPFQVNQTVNDTLVFRTLFGLTAPVGLGTVAVGLNGMAYLPAPVSAYNPVDFGVAPLTSAIPLTVEVLWAWGGGSNPASTAQLTGLQALVIPAVP